MAQSILQTVDHAISLLELLAQHPSGLSTKELENSLCLNKLAVHRLLSTLANRGFVEKTSSYTYIIGMKVVELSSVKLNSLQLKTEAQQFMRHLAYETEQPVHLAILHNYGATFDAMYIEKIEPISSIRMYSQIGKTIPLYCSSVGKVLLFDKSHEYICNCLEKCEFQTLTYNTLSSIDELTNEINNFRPLGYAIDNAEHEPGIYCIAAPIYDYTGKIIAAVSTAGKYNGFIENRNDPFVQFVKETGMSISRCMGYSL